MSMVEPLLIFIIVELAVIIALIHIYTDKEK